MNMERHNFRNYFRYLLKQQFPLFLVFFFVMGIPFISYCSSGTWIYKTECTGSCFLNDTESFIFFFMIAIPALLSALVAPISVFSYRYRKGSGDTYRQLPMKPAGIRKARMLVSGIYLAAAFTLVFWLGVLVLAIRQGGKLPEDTQNYVYVRYFFQYGYFPLLYLVILVSMAAEFFASSAVCKMSNNVLDSIVYILLTMVLRVLVVILPVLFINNCITDTGIRIYLAPTLSPYSAIMFPEYVLRNLMLYGTTPDHTVLDIVLVSIGFFLFLLYGGLSAWYSLKSREPGGEYNGRALPQNGFIRVLPHIAVPMVVLLEVIASATGSDFNLVYLIFLVNPFGYALNYYLLMALCKRTFKIGKKAALTMVFVGLGTIALSVLALIISNCCH